jgi:predicted  nucleic acid-binding Zn-ribbon protein
VPSGESRGGVVIGRVEAIYRLQSIDLEIEAKADAVRGIEDQLGSEEELLSARRALQGRQEALRESQAKLRDLEMDLAQVTSKVSAAKSALYGGEITNPKELAGIEQELEYLGRRQSVLEDDALVVMADVEEQEGHVEAAEEDLSRTRECHEAAQLELRQQAEHLRDRLISLSGEKEEILKAISSKDLAKYEGLRVQRSGQAVALLENGICQGCRVALPTSLVQRVRRGTELVQCGSCQRILYSAR